jgi:hypothetical protein
MANREEIVNGCVMTYDEQGRLIGRKGGLFWDMECQYNDNGQIVKYENSVGYSIKGYFWKKKNKWHLQWTLPTNDVFKIKLQQDALKKMIASRYKKEDNLL